MSGSLNRVTLIGNLGADPEIRTLNDGAKIASFSIATSERWKDRTSGEVRERTEWHRVVIFAPGLAKVAEQYLQKGSKILVEGKLQTRKWQDQAGQDRYSTEIAVTPYNGLLTFLDRSRNDVGAPASDAPSSRGASAPRSAPDSGDLDEEVPF
ncbi:MAG: single-stranded DNA-binding protein [Acetobacteraceae bacterium]|nr:single-stranded DNA-binding protein [Acetobacteraceae bacterium]